MKKLLLFFTIIYFVGCTNFTKTSIDHTIIDCPNVFFSSENRIFVDNSKENIDLNEVNFRALLNNYGFVGNCYSDENYYYYNIDLLSIVEPINPSNKSIDFPIFTLMYDAKNQLIDKKYFRITGELDFNNEINKYITTDIVGNINIIHDVKKKKVSSITIGFINLK